MCILDKVLANPGDYKYDVENLGKASIPTPVLDTDFADGKSRVLISTDAEYNAKCVRDGVTPPSFIRAGAHRELFHAPAWSRAAILTAGGLCPGLNHVIKGLVEILSFDYGIKTIFGIRYGYRGIVGDSEIPPMLLNPDIVDNIHTLGGTILGSSRGQQETSKIIETLVRMNINLLFCIGGDGSLRAAHEIATECLKRKLSISVVGVPKTIDNDLNFVGRTFGFETAVTATESIIESAHMEAKGCVNGIGLVKLMGRDSGFISAYAAVASPVCNFCLIPEQDFTLDGPNGLLAAIERRLSIKRHAVVLVAEGAGQNLFDGSVVRKDASGNILKDDIGELLKSRITDHFKSLGRDISVKYFDPSYSIRSIPAVGVDAIHCFRLARAAVHAAMAGYTDCVVGDPHNSGNYALVPIKLATIERQKLDLSGDLWRTVLDSTRQTDYFFPPEDDAGRERVRIL